MKTQAITAAPCAHCPFRKDVPCYLRRERRRDIARALIDGGTFHCHSTVDYNVEDEDDDPDTSRASMCAGAAKSLLHDGGTTNLMRVMERLGAVDLDRTAERGPEVWGLMEWQIIPEGATGDDLGDPDEDDDIETCNTVNSGCLAPAGYAGYNGGISLGTEPADLRCIECDEPVCSACADDDGRCGSCAGYEEE